MKKVYNLLQALPVCCLHLSCWFVSLFILPLFSIDGVHRMLVATSEAMLYIASIDPREGRECRCNLFKLVTACTPYDECMYDESQHVLLTMSTLVLLTMSTLVPSRAVFSNFSHVK